MKRFILILLFSIPTITTIAQITNDSTKYTWYKTQYGIRIPRLWPDSFSHIPYGDTTQYHPGPSKSYLMMHTDKKIYDWDSTKWVPVNRATQLNDSAFIVGKDTIIIRGTGGSQNLQQVTDRGLKTTDSVSLGGLRTKNILTDTSNQNDYTWAVLPDLQYMTYQDQNVLYSMFDFLKNKKDSLNLQSVFQVGDLTEYAGDAEFRLIDTMLKKLDTAGIPWTAAIGNHDFNGGLTCSGSSQWNVYMPQFLSLNPFFGGNYNGLYNNYYTRFSSGGKDYIAIATDLMPDDSALAYGQRIIDSNLNRHAIIVTHAYITYFGEKSNDTSAFNALGYCRTGGNNGQAMWDKFVKKNKTIDFVFSGHFIKPTFTLGVPAPPKGIFQTGENGNIVYQMFQNWQDDSLGGNGYMTLINFHPRQGTADVTYYSPYLNKYDSRFLGYSIDYPATNANTALGVARNYGMLSVGGRATFEDSVFLSRFPRGRVLRTNRNGIIDTVSNVMCENGNIGFGTYSPSFKIDVVGEIKTDSITGGNTASDSLILSSTSNAAKGFIGLGPNVAITESTGNIGIGTRTPGDAMVLNRGNATWGIKLNNSTAASGNATRFYMTNDGGETAQFYQGWTGNTFLAHGAVVGGGGTGGFGIATNGGPIYFSKSFAVSGTNIWATIATNGNFGIGAGLITPLDKLHVTGTVRITDTLKLPNIIQKSIDTTNQKIVVSDASGNILKSYWPSSPTTLKGILSSYTFPSISGGTSTSTTATITGAVAGDMVLIQDSSGGAFTDGEFYDARVSANDTVTIRRSYTVAGTIASSTRTFNIMVFKY